MEVEFYLHGSMYSCVVSFGYRLLREMIAERNRIVLGVGSIMVQWAQTSMDTELKSQE